MSVKMFLRCPKRSRPDIALPHKETVIIGRSPLTGVKDSRLSRHQLEIKADCKKKVAKVKVIGHNKSTLNGFQCIKGEKVTLNAGEEIELLQGQYERILGFADKDEEVKKKSVKEKVVKTVEEKVVKTVEDSPAPPKKKMAFGAFGWKSHLLTAMDDETMKVDEDDEVVVIRDLFPKAKVHYLVLPRERIDDLSALDMHHVDLLAKMHEMGLKQCENHPELEFKLGYHSVASMLQLHLHVISQDFVSSALKHKKHWNSYNTEYFLDSEMVQEELTSNGYVSNLVMDPERAKEVLNTPLKCHKCNYKPKHMPDLKKHLESHQ